MMCNNAYIPFLERGVDGRPPHLLVFKSCRPPLHVRKRWGGSIAWPTNRYGSFHHSNLLNSVTEIPASRIRSRSVPFATTS